MNAIQPVIKSATIVRVIIAIIPNSGRGLVIRRVIDVVIITIISLARLNAIYFFEEALNPLLKITIGSIKRSIAVYENIVPNIIPSNPQKYPNIKGGFMHVPYATSQTVNQPAGTPGMNLNDIARGIELSIEAIIENPTDIMAQGGTTH